MEVIVAYGHENITSKHRNSIEITKDKEITKRADCIIGVSADKGAAELSEKFKHAAKNENATIKVVFRVGELKETVTGKGHPKLSFYHKNDIVIRKSTFVCPRTLMIKADKSAGELERKIINLLKNRNQKLVVEISVET